MLMIDDRRRNWKKFYLDINLEADWNKLENVDVPFEDYVTCDNEGAITGTPTDY